MNRKKIYLITIIQLFFSYSLGQNKDDKIKKASLDPAWLKLLHYKKSGDNKFTSQLDGVGFFLAQNGKNDPLSELKENIKSFQRNHLKIGKYKVPSQCAFPLRYQFVKSHLKLKIKDTPCPKLDQFMRKFRTDQIFLIFSSAYPNNPGSMFGHTFLKLNSSRKKASAMLDHGISYAAYTPPGEGGALFAIKGIFGGYRGLFSVLPYYVKLREYNHVESRDIWEYQLNLTPQEIHHLLLHVWEIETNSYYDYYFFSENCAYHILSLLEAINPELSLTHNLLYITPADAVKKVSQIPNYIKSINFRPSIRRKASLQYEKLNDKQKQQFHLSLKPKQKTLTKDTQVLDAAITYLNYKKQSNKELKQSSQKILHSLLIHRSQLPRINSNLPKLTQIDYQAHNRPDIGHDPSMVEFRLGASQSSFFQEFKLQSSYHDLLASDKGYEPFSEIIFPTITLRNEKSEISLESLNFIRITSLTPITTIDQKLSWSLQFQVFRDRVLGNCSQKYCYTSNFYTGSGVSSYFFHKKSIISAMFFFNVEANKEFAKGYRVGPTLQLLFVSQPFSQYKMRLSYRAFYKAFPQKPRWQRKSIEWGHSFFINRQMELRLTLSTIVEKYKKEELKISFLRYF